jgi:transcriptional regulator with XRE-family HTH domain
MQALISDYLNGMSQAELAQKYFISQATVSRILKSAGFRRRAIVVAEKSINLGKIPPRYNIPPNYCSLFLFSYLFLSLKLAFWLIGMSYRISVGELVSEVK